MTRPKRWPHNAEAARMESLAAAREIVALGRKAKRHLMAGKRELAASFISEMQLHAKEIEVQMRICKEGR